MSCGRLSLLTNVTREPGEPRSHSLGDTPAAVIVIECAPRCPSGSAAPAATAAAAAGRTRPRIAVRRHRRGGRGRRERNEERGRRESLSNHQKNFLEMLKPRYQSSLPVPPRASWPMVVAEAVREIELEHVPSGPLLDAEGSVIDAGLVAEPRDETPRRCRPSVGCGCGRRSLRRSTKDAETRRVRALEVLAEHGLADHAHDSVHSLSGGQRQLLALAGVLAIHPTIVVADEPTTLSTAPTPGA